MLKKITSLLTTLVLTTSIASAFAVVANAENADTVKPTAAIELSNVPEELEIGSTFQLKVTFKDIPVSSNDDDWAGTAFTACNFKLNIPGYGTIITKNGKTYHTDPLGTASTSAAQKTLSTDGLVSYGWAGPVTADSAYRVGAGDIYVLNLK